MVATTQLRVSSSWRTADTRRGSTSVPDCGPGGASGAFGHGLGACLARGVEVELVAVLSPRGDGPGTHALSASEASCSPRTRGWSPTCRVRSATGRAPLITNRQVLDCSTNVRRKHASSSQNSLRTDNTITICHPPTATSHSRRTGCAACRGRPPARTRRLTRSTLYRPNAMSEYEALSVATISGRTPPSRLSSVFRASAVPPLGRRPPRRARRTTPADHGQDPTRNHPHCDG